MPKFDSSAPALRLVLPLSLFLIPAALPAQSDAATRAAAIVERATKDDFESARELLALLDHADWIVRREAVRGLGIVRAEWADERIAALLDDEKVAPFAAEAIGRLVGKDRVWPPLERADDLVAAAKAWRAEQLSEGEGWVTHCVSVGPSGTTVLRGQMHAERGTAYFVFCDGASGVETRRWRWSGPIRSIGWDATGARALVSRDHGDAQVVDVASGRVLRELGGRRKRVWSVALSGDGSRAAIATERGLAVFDCETGATTFAADATIATTTAFLPRSDLLVVCDRAGRMVVFDDVGREVVVATGLGTVVKIAPAPDGRFVASLFADGVVAVYERAAKRELWRRAAHGKRPNDVAWSADGAFVATAGADATVRVYSAAGGVEDAYFKTLRNVISLRFSGRSIVAAFYDGTTSRLTTADVSTRPVDRDR